MQRIVNSTIIMKFFGYAKRMTEAQDLKSSTYENVKTIIIDEYPIEKNKRYYLPNERNDSCWNP